MSATRERERPGQGTLAHIGHSRDPAHILRLSDTLFARASQGDGSGDGKTKVSKKNRIFMFQSNGKEGSAKIDAFIKKAFDWYTQKVEAAVDNSRYMYISDIKDVGRGRPRDGAKSVAPVFVRFGRRGNADKLIAHFKRIFSTDTKDPVIRELCNKIRRKAGGSAPLLEKWVIKEEQTGATASIEVGCSL